MEKVKKQQFEDEAGYDSPTSSSSKKKNESTFQEVINVKIKKSDNQIIKLSINLLQDYVSDIKERAF